MSILLEAAPQREQHSSYLDNQGLGLKHWLLRGIPKVTHQLEVVVEFVG